MRLFWNDKTIWDKFLRVVLVILIIGVMATPLAGTMFTFLSEDDFSYESGGIEAAAQYQSSLVGSFRKTVDIYFNQQGCYTPMFLDHLLRPYSRFGMPGFHLAMFLYVAVFLASLVAMSSVLVKDKTVSLAVMLAAVMSVFAMSCTGLDTDIIYWHTETLGYTLMMGFLFFGLYFSLLSFREKSKKAILYIILSSVLAFLASGASLTVTAVNCAVLIAVLILEYKELVKRKYLAIPFISGFIGALINAFAPGNFVRSNESVTPGHETVFDGIRDTFSCLFKAYPQAYDLVFLLVILALLLLCLIYKVRIFDGGISNSVMAIVVGGVFLLQYFETFPGAFGGHSAELTKHLLIEHLIITRLSTIFVVVCLAQWIREHFVEKKGASNKVSAFLSDHKYLWAMFAVAVALVLILPASRNIFRGSFTAMTCRDLKSGNFVKAYRVREYQLATFELAEDGSDCIIYNVWDTSNESLPGLGITEDCEWFVNRSAANMFGLKTTTVISQ